MNLQGGGPRGSGSPGKGGWPTIRYYNKETGTQGADYVKKTSAAMCSELGPEGGLLQRYIEEAGKTSLCSIVAPEYKGCTEKEIGFLAKAVEMDKEQRDQQIKRLTEVGSKKMKKDLAQWVNQRLSILTKLAEDDNKDEL